MTQQPVFTKAVRSKAKARIALDGPSGSGKTYTALLAAKAFGDRIAVIDTEHGSASLYSDLFDFDTLELANYDPRNYIAAIQAAEDAGYDVVVVDSLSHAWEGEGGALDMADKAAKRMKTPNSFTAWKEVTPVQRDLVEKLISAKCHVIVTMRTKTEYSIDKDSNGKTKIERVGLAPIQRQGIEYEFQVMGDLDLNHTITVSKSRCPIIADAVVSRPDTKWFGIFAKWLSEGSDTPPPPPQSFVIEQAAQKAATPAPAPVAGPRPKLDFNAIPGLIANKAQSTYKGQLATVAHRNMVQSNISAVVPEEMIPTVYVFLFGAETVAGAASGHVLAALDWMKDPVYQEELAELCVALQELAEQNPVEETVAS